MCSVCGCAAQGAAAVPAHASGHGCGDHHDHVDGLARRMVRIETDILAKNDRYAAENRAYFTGQSILALNLVSSPGSGKTTLLVETIRRLSGTMPLAVIEGDQQTDNDAERIRATGTPAVQINTGKSCHLDAHGVGHALAELALEYGAVVFIENVGNLVCPASFDLGEAAKVAVFSVTEGVDKPLKYPDIFAASRLVIVNKTDLAPHCDVDMRLLQYNVARVSPDAEMLLLSARTGEGMDSWIRWLKTQRAAVPARDPSEFLVEEGA